MTLVVEGMDRSNLYDRADDQGYDGFVIDKKGINVRYQKCTPGKGQMSIEGLRYQQDAETHFKTWYTCASSSEQPQLQDQLLSECQGDDYACLRAYRGNPIVRANASAVDIRDFAHEFLKYKDDPNNYALFLWGYVDLMLDYYKMRYPSLISNEDIVDQGNYDRLEGVMNIYGEPGVYPQFGEKIVQSE